MPRWTGDWEAAGGPLSSIQLLKSHDNERGQHFVPALTGTGSLELGLRSETVQDTDLTASSSCSAAGSVTAKGDVGKLVPRKAASQPRPPVPCTKGSKTLSTNTYSLLSQKALTLQHAKTLPGGGSSRPSQTSLSNSFSSSSGLASRPSTLAVRNEHASAFSMAADSCIKRVRLRRIKQALLRWRKQAVAVSAVLADAQRRRAKTEHRQSRIRASSHMPFITAMGEESSNPAENPASDGFDRSLELEGAAQIVSILPAAE